MLLISTDLPDDKDRVEDQSRDNYREKYDPEDQKCDLTKIQQYPRNIERDSQDRQRNAKD